MKTRPPRRMPITWRLGCQRVAAIAPVARFVSTSILDRDQDCARALKVAARQTLKSSLAARLAGWLADSSDRATSEPDSADSGRLTFARRNLCPLKG